MSDVDVSDFVEQASAYGFDETIQRLIKAIETAGMTVLARIDHAAGARHIGMSMPNTIVMLYIHHARRHADHAGGAARSPRPAAARTDP